MTEVDPFEYDDGPYVLGALDDDDRRAFEAHLETCAACRARVAELRGPAELLAMLRTDGGADAGGAADVVDAGPPSASGGVAMPDTLLPGLLRRARQERRRRRLLTGALAAVAAACLVALAIVAWPTGSSSPARPPAQALSAVQPSALSVSARLIPRGWGTQIDLQCRYPSYEHRRFAYELVVFDRANHPHVAGDWSLVPGRDGIDFTTGTSVPRAQIAKVQVRTTSGTPLLELRL